MGAPNPLLGLSTNSLGRYLYRIRLSMYLVVRFEYLYLRGRDRAYSTNLWSNKGSLTSNPTDMLALSTFTSRWSGMYIFASNSIIAVRGSGSILGNPSNWMSGLMSGARYLISF